uniref:Uncharacterized protein n=1 Tax=Oryza punctata TaxID=4537 RepID=A0A0E0LVQ1_ORYPU
MASRWPCRWTETMDGAIRGARRAPSSYARRGGLVVAPVVTAAGRETDSYVLVSSLAVFTRCGALASTATDTEPRAAVGAQDNAVVDARDVVSALRRGRALPGTDGGKRSGRRAHASPCSALATSVFCGGSAMATSEACTFSSSTAVRPVHPRQARAEARPADGEEETKRRKKERIRREGRQKKTKGEENVTTMAWFQFCKILVVPSRYLE